MRAATYPRPLLRGVSHEVAFFVTLVGGAILIALTPSQRWGVVVYALGVAAMFGASATLHRRDWQPRAYGWLRRVDHAMIFACIAGTYTPFCVYALGLDTTAGTHLLALAWGTAAIGMLRALLWPHAPRPLTASLFVAVGWVALGYVPEIHGALDATSFAMLVAGGVWLTIAAVVYLVRRPDPWPETFGYHEVFHVMIILGVACHFAVVSRVAHVW